MEEVFPKPPIVGYKRQKNIKDYLIRSKVPPIQSNKPLQRSIANDRIQLQGLKYSLDETTPVDTIQVKQNTKKNP